MAEVHENFNQTLNIYIIRNKKVFLLHDIVGYLKKLYDDYGAEPTFTHTVSLRRELLKIIENKLDFFPSAKFVILHS